MITEPEFTLLAGAEVEACCALMQQYYNLDQIPFDPDLARARLSQLRDQPELGRIWLIRSENQIAGYVAVTFGFGLEHGLNATIDELFILEHFRHKGLGGKALAFLESALKSQGIESIHTEVERSNEPAIHFWQGLGFHQHDRYPMVKMI